jgi:hypothetical protein
VQRLHSVQQVAFVVLLADDKSGTIQVFEENELALAMKALSDNPDVTVPGRGY